MLKYLISLILLSSLALNMHAKETTVTIVNIDGINYLHDSNKPKELKSNRIGIIWEKQPEYILKRNPKNEQQYHAIHNRANKDYNKEQQDLEDYNQRIKDQNKRNNNP